MSVKFDDRQFRQLRSGVVIRFATTTISAETGKHRSKNFKILGKGTDAKEGNSEILEFKGVLALGFAFAFVFAFAFSFAFAFAFAFGIGICFLRHWDRDVHSLHFGFMLLLFIRPRTASHPLNDRFKTRNNTCID